MNKMNFLALIAIALCKPGTLQAMEKNATANPPVIIKIDEKTLIAALSKLNVTIEGTSTAVSVNKHFLASYSAEPNSSTVTQWKHSFSVNFAEKK